MSRKVDEEALAADPGHLAWKQDLARQLRGQRDPFIWGEGETKERTEGEMRESGCEPWKIGQEDLSIGFKRVSVFATVSESSRDRRCLCMHASW